jgi:hypothetical protein
MAYVFISIDLTGSCIKNIKEKTKFCARLNPNSLIPDSLRIAMLFPCDCCNPFWSMAIKDGRKLVMQISKEISGRLDM